MVNPVMNMQWKKPFVPQEKFKGESVVISVGPVCDKKRSAKLLAMGMDRGFGSTQKVVIILLIVYDCSAI